MKKLWKRREYRGMREGKGKKKISVLLAPRCLAALFKSYWSSINTFNCFLWFPGLWSVAFQGEAAFLTLLQTWVYPAGHALGQNVEEKNLCLLEDREKRLIILAGPFCEFAWPLKTTLGCLLVARIYLQVTGHRTEWIRGDSERYNKRWDKHLWIFLGCE